MAEMEVSMSPRCPERWSRRAFVRALTLAGTAGLLAVRAAPVAAEPPPETTRLAIVQSGFCFAPQYVAESLLRAEGFSDVHYVKKTTTIENYEALASGHAHLGFGYASALIARIDGGDPVVFVAGGHVGCQQVVGHEHIRAIRDLRGKRFAIAGPGAPDHIQVASILAYVGIDPRTDIAWVAHGGAAAESMRLFLFSSFFMNTIPPVERVGGAFCAPSNELVENAHFAFSTARARSTGSSRRTRPHIGSRSDDLGASHT